MKLAGLIDASMIKKLEAMKPALAANEDRAAARIAEFEAAYEAAAAKEREERLAALEAAKLSKRAFCAKHINTKCDFMQDSCLVMDRTSENLLHIVVVK